MNHTITTVIRALLSVVFIAFFGFIVLHVLDRETEYANGVKDVVLFLLGALTTSVVTIVSFWFSSSQGSADKTAALHPPPEDPDA